MKLAKGIQIVLIGASIVALAACSTQKKSTNPGSIQDANAAYGQAETSGIGEEGGFGGAGQAQSQRTYYFDYDSYTVRHSDMAAIEANANYLVAHPNAKIMLEGHTDPRGSREYNIGLGERRAKAVAQILTAKGVSRNQIRVVSYGAEKLASPGRSEADYQRDRRCVLVYLQR